MIQPLSRAKLLRSNDIVHPLLIPALCSLFHILITTIYSDDCVLEIINLSTVPILWLLALLQMPTITFFFLNVFLSLCKQLIPPHTHFPINTTSFLLSSTVFTYIYLYYFISDILHSI